MTPTDERRFFTVREAAVCLLFDRIRRNGDIDGIICRSCASLPSLPFFVSLSAARAAQSGAPRLRRNEIQCNRPSARVVSKQHNRKEMQMRLVIAAAMALLMIGGVAVAQYQNPSQVETQSAPGTSSATNMPSTPGVVTSQVPNGSTTLPSLNGTTNQGTALPAGAGK